MVSVAYFRLDAENIINDIERQCNALEEGSGEYFIATRNIQRVFRGFITRKYIALLHLSAICIQRHWRGFVGRIIYEQLLKERFEELCRIYYREMATRIQTHWKGYWVRSRIFSYYKLKSWLNFVRMQNKQLKCSTERYRSEQNNVELEQREQEAKEWIVYILFKLHHLLRTHQISGIYSLPKTAKLSDIEKMLTCLKYKDFMTFYHSYLEDVRLKKMKEMPPYILQNCKYPCHFEKEWYEHKKKHLESYTEVRFPADRFSRYEVVVEPVENTNACTTIELVPADDQECGFCANQIPHAKY